MQGLTQSNIFTFLGGREILLIKACVFAIYRCLMVLYKLA